MLDEMMQISPIRALEYAVPLTLSDMLAIANTICGYSAAYFFDPDLQTHFLALGESMSVILSGDKRFLNAKQFIERLNQTMASGDAGKVRIFGGFAFEQMAHPRTKIWTGWPDGKLFVPSILITHQEKTSKTIITVFQGESDFPASLAQSKADSSAWINWVTDVCGKMSDSEMNHPKVDLTLLAQGSNHEERDKWIRLVESGSSAVRQGLLKKVVLARYVVEPAHTSISDALLSLHTQYPDNFTFAFWHEETCFIGSSPERLASVSARVLNVDCLAGSERRGKTTDEDKQLGDSLLASSKNRAEHKAVVDWVTDKVGPFVADLQVESEPALKKLSNVQHLYTPVRGVMKDLTGIFEIVRTLHPTPAVAGVPEADARSFIRNHEQMDRGWYAGPVGWVDLQGNGTFAVALRSGLVAGEYAALFAGAGIMGDSVPETEWEETELKFMPMRDALMCERDSRSKEE